MTGASKILTVSYGTFSCTLEGFDDPLTTMKFIAEYFRDLAADDRYFGSEPATPDAAMMHRIAERESNHRVEARVQDNGGVHLRATEAEDQPAPQPAPVQVEQDLSSPMILTQPITTPTPRAAFVTPATPARIEGVAAKLMRIRAAARHDTETVDAVATEVFIDPPAPDAVTADPQVTAAPAPQVFPEQMPADDAISDWRLSESDGFLADDDDDEADAAQYDGYDEFQTDDDHRLAETIKAAMSMNMTLEPEIPVAPVAATPPPKPRVPRFVFDDDLDDDLDGETGGDDGQAEPTAPAPDRTSALGKFRLAKARLIKIRKPSPPVVEPAPAEPATPGDALRQLSGTSGDTSINRLIAQTNSEMDVPEQRARWSAIAHLKAAVATTVADRAARGGEDLPDHLTDAYKDELTRIVNPENAEEAGGLDLPAPLVLVSEQRIDRKAAEAPEEPSQPMIRPRRVAVSNLALNSMIDPLDYDYAEEEDEDEDDTGDVSVFFDPHDFAEFAQRLGADDMGEFIQAAGVYAALIECRPHFSPMHLIRQIITSSELGDFDREEGLRAFGALLREGKIERVRKGQYIVTDESEYMVEAQRILG